MLVMVLDALISRKIAPILLKRSLLGAMLCWPKSAPRLAVIAKANASMLAIGVPTGKPTAGARVLLVT